MKINGIDNSLQRNKQSFGMALKITEPAIVAIVESGKQSMLKKAMPVLEDKSKKVDILIDVPIFSPSNLKFIATPLRESGENTWFSRLMYKVNQHIGETKKPLDEFNSEKDFIDQTKRAIKNLNDSPKAKELAFEAWLNKKPNIKPIIK